MERFDAIVLGIGGMGSAALYQLARRNQAVLGLEQFNIPHDLGSSHGVTRIIRLAYYEHPSYVPLLRRSFELWRDLENISHERLLTVTGSIDAAPKGHPVFEGSRESCLLHHLPHEVLTSKQLHQRYPGYELPTDSLAVYQPDGGFLAPENCIVAYVQAALDLGAAVHGQEHVQSWNSRDDGIEVHTDRGSYQANKLVITAGAWAGKVLPKLARLARPERQVLGWFQPHQPALFEPAVFPVFNMVVEEGRYYGFPVHGIPGFKIGRYHHLDEQVDPDNMDRTPNRQDEQCLRICVERHFPKAAGPILSMKACLFTNSPDEHFIIDHLPEDRRVLIAAGFSGHGFKFCSVIGEILADLALHGSTRHDLNLFKVGRFAH
jgi:sarcosine oxidase